MFLFTVIYFHNNSLLETTVPSTSDDYTTEIATSSKFDLQKFWNDRNLNLLSSEQKEQLDILMHKARVGESLTKDEKDTLWSLKELVFNSKLPKEDFSDFISIINKRRNGNKLNEGELQRLNNYYKIVKEYSVGN